MGGGGKYWCTRQAREGDGWVFLSSGMVLVLSIIELMMEGEECFEGYD